MIISASYRTDIPAFYGRWFMNRLAAGYCRVPNPYAGTAHRIALSAEAVDGFVFWTKNLGPFLASLEEVARLGHPFVVQYGINGYPRPLEAFVPNTDVAAAHLRRVADRHGPRVAVWRYDPIIITSATPPEWHIDRVTDLARSLRTCTDEVVVSFVQPYRKTLRNMGRALRRHGWVWRDPAPDEKRDMLRRLAERVADYGMTLRPCTQPTVTPTDVEPARCIDGARLADVAGRTIAHRVKGNRPGCLCAESRDIGAYDTCIQGCAYCYAVTDHETARRRLRRHDPMADILIPMGRASEKTEAGVGD